MNFFDSTYRVLRRELRRLSASPSIITLMAILPVAAFSFFGLFFSEGVATDMPIAVVDRDDTPLSRQLVTMIDATPSCRVACRLQDMEEGARLIRSGKLHAVVFIPAHFERDVYGNVPTSVQSYINGANLTANGLVGKDLQTVATTFSAGIQVQILMKAGLSEVQAYAQMMPVKFDRHIMFNPYVNYGYYLMPSFMPLLLAIFTLLLTVVVIGSELRNKTAGEWFDTAGGNTISALIGKMLPYTVVMFLMGLFMSNVMHHWLGVPQNGSTLMLVLADLMLVLSYQSIGILIITLFGNLRLSLSVGGGYSVLAFTFSGLTFPRMAMDQWLQVFTYMFPFTFFTDIFIDQAMRGAPPFYTVQYFWCMAAFVVLPLLCLPRLKKIATTPEYWGRL